MSIAWAAVTDAFPNDTVLAAVDASAEGQTYIDWASEQADAAVLGTRYDQVLTLLAAHMAVCVASGGVGSAGPVSAESVDGVSRSYAVAAELDYEDLSGTSYGRRARALVATSPKARLPRMY